MAQLCVLGSICDGCMRCQKQNKIGICAYCKSSINVGYEYYQIDDGAKVCKECLMDYLEKEETAILKVAERNC